MLRRRFLLNGGSFWSRIINAFKNRVASDGGTFESEPCLTSGLPLLGQNLYDKASLILTANAYKAGKLYSLKPTNGSGDFTFSRASAAMRRNASGIWENTANNMPRLHYPAGGGCPSWLFEPQKTNTVLNSNNAFENGSASSATTSEPTNINGVNFRLMTAPSADNFIYISGGNLSVTPTGLMCLSIFFKAGTCSLVELIDQSSTGRFVRVDLSNGTITAQSSGLICGVIQDGNEIYRVYIVQDFTSIGFRYDVYAKTAGTLYYSTTQLEAGVLPTSPIITTGSTVTRIADSCVKTGITSLIGQTEGTLFADLIYNSAIPTARVIAVSEATIANRVIITLASNRIQIIGRFNNNVFANLNPSNTLLNGRNKIAFAYKSGDSVLYLNGVQIGTSADSFTFGLPIDSAYYGCAETTGVSSESGLFNPGIVFPSRLTNSELVALTTL